MDLVKDPTVEKWLSYYTKDKDVYDSKINYLRDFINYIRTKPDFKDATPSSLIEFQLNATNADQRTKYKILDILQEYINKKGGRASTQTTRYSIVKNFFKKSRAALPDDDFRPVPTVSQVSNNLTIEIIKRLISASDLDMKAIYFTLFMALVEREKFKHFNLHYGSELVKHLKSHGINEPFKFDIPGRKGSKFRAKYYTFIGRDALEAWQEYFDNSERGWPKEGEPIVYDRDGKPLSKDSLSARHLRLLRKLQLIKSNNGGSETRHGYGLHNFRVEAKTHLHNRAKPEGFDMDYSKFWMGHITDPNRYDRFYRDEEAAVKQYKIAEKYLNLKSGGSADTKVRQELQDLKQNQETKEKSILKVIEAGLQEKTEKIEQIRKDSDKQIEELRRDLTNQLITTQVFDYVLEEHDYPEADYPLKVDGRLLRIIQAELSEGGHKPEGLIRMSELILLIETSDEVARREVERLKKNHKDLIRSYPPRPEVMKEIYARDKLHKRMTAKARKSLFNSIYLKEKTSLGLQSFIKRYGVRPLTSWGLLNLDDQSRFLKVYLKKTNIDRKTREKLEAKKKVIDNIVVSVREEFKKK